jgi:serine/threonine-protein kinase
VVDYTSDATSFQRSNPRLWVDKAIVNNRIPGGNLFDIMPDGKRIIVLPRPEPKSGPKENLHLTVLINFFDEVRRRIPASGR